MRAATGAAWLGAFSPPKQRMSGSEGSAGGKLLALCARAESELVLVAPFMKVESLRRALAVVSSNVAITCVTRWRPEEVAAGVSDLGVFDELKRRSGGMLLLLPRLHAKYFRADDRCLVGSANLTGRALGWAYPPNVELLIEEPSERRDLARFETLVTESAREATEGLRSLVAAAASEMAVSPARITSSDYREEALEEDEEEEVARSEGPFGASDEVAEAWLPTLRQPRDLYIAYRGMAERLAESSRIAAARDLRVVDPAPGLRQPWFEATVGIALLQMPMIAEIDRLLMEPQRFGAVRDLIAKKKDIPREDASFCWQTTMRWLIHFLPGRYARKAPAYSEILVRLVP